MPHPTGQGPSILPFRDLFREPRPPLLRLVVGAHALFPHWSGPLPLFLRELSTLCGDPPTFPVSGAWEQRVLLHCSVIAVVLGALGWALFLSTRLGATVLEAQTWAGERTTARGLLPYSCLAPLPPPLLLPGRLWWPAGVRRSPSGSGVLGVRGALRPRGHAGRLHQHLQICGLDPGGHQEQLTGSFYLYPCPAWGPL